MPDVRLGFPASGKRLAAFGDNVLKWGNIIEPAAMKNLLAGNADRYLRMG